MHRPSRGAPAAASCAACSVRAVAARAREQPPPSMVDNGEAKGSTSDSNKSENVNGELFLPVFIRLPGAGAGSSGVTLQRCE